MKTLTLAAIRCSLMFTAVAALSVVYPASVQAVPTTYQYTGNPFTIVDVDGRYTTSDFVTAMVTLRAPLGPNLPPDTPVFPIAFTLSDGVQTLRYNNVEFTLFTFATDPSGAITHWALAASHSNPYPIFDNLIVSCDTCFEGSAFDFGQAPFLGFGMIFGPAGLWNIAGTVPDAGSTISLMTLTLMALGLVARRFQRAEG